MVVFSSAHTLRTLQLRWQHDHHNHQQQQQQQLAASFNPIWRETAACSCQRQARAIVNRSFTDNRSTSRHNDERQREKNGFRLSEKQFDSGFVLRPVGIFAERTEHRNLRRRLFVLPSQMRSFIMRHLTRIGENCRERFQFMNRDESGTTVTMCFI